MSDPYRMVPEDPRAAAEANLLNARAELIREITQGLKVANNTGSDSYGYAQKLEALESLYKTVME